MDISPRITHTPAIQNVAHKEENKNNIVALIPQ
jgi:hypothetical protein